MRVVCLHREAVFERRSSAEADRMSPVHLRRIHAERNMRRFYALDVRPNLFGHWAFIREWGRVGSSGQVMTLLFPTAREAYV